MKIKWYYILFIALQILIIYSAAWVIAKYSDQKLEDSHGRVNTAMDNNYSLNIASIEDAPNVDRPFISEEIYKKLLDDLVEAEYNLAVSMEENEDINLDNYYTDDNVKSIRKSIEGRDKDAPVRSEYVLHHRLYLELMSIDYKFSILKDSSRASVTIIQSPEGHRAFIDSFVQRYVLMHQDGYWKIYKKKNLALKSSALDSLTKNSAQTVTQSQLTSIRGINYYPKDHAWKKFWKEYDEYEIQQDLLRIKDLGLNTLRVFIPYIPVDYKTQFDSTRSNILHFMDQCQRLDLQVIPCLFDFNWSTHYSDWAAQGLYIDSLAAALREHPALHSWDIKNEADLDFDLYGENQVLNWCKFVIYRLRSMDDKHPLSLGWAYIENAHLLSEDLDFVSFHSYNAPSELPKKISKLRQRIGNKGLLASEVGRSTYHGIWKPWGSNEKNQAQYYGQWNTLREQENLPFALWTMNDFDSVPSSVVGKLPWRKAPQKEYGLIDQSGKKKPAYAVIKNDTRINLKQGISKYAILGLVFILIAIILYYYTQSKKTNYETSHTHGIPSE